MATGNIELRGVRRCFRIDARQAITALDGISLEIAEGAAVAVSGPSGSGKSTLLHIIGALPPARWLRHAPLVPVLPGE